MLPVNLVVVFLIGCSRINSETIPPALRFGQTINDYVQLPAGILDSSRYKFSLCSWVKKRYRASERPIIFGYNVYLEPSQIALGDDGFYNWVVGSNIRLESKYTVPDGEWFHLCMTWSTADYTTRVYLNGDMIGSTETNRRELWRGARACIGNRAQETKHKDFIFGGDLYQLNIYRRVLEQAEIRTLAYDMCSSARDTSMVLTWEEVLKNERTGNVAEISAVSVTDCVSVLGQRLRLMEEQLKTIENGLKDTISNQKNTEVELNSTQKDLKEIRKDLDITKQDLVESYSTRVDLNELTMSVTARLDEMAKNQEKNERLYLILTIVFGVLSAVLITLLTTLLVKRLRVNRTDQIVEK